MGRPTPAADQPAIPNSVSHDRYRSAGQLGISELDTARAGRVKGWIEKGHERGGPDSGEEIREFLSGSSRSVSKYGSAASRTATSKVHRRSPFLSTGFVTPISSLVRCHFVSPVSCLGTGAAVAVCFSPEEDCTTAPPLRSMRLSGLNSRSSSAPPDSHHGATYPVGHLTETCVTSSRRPCRRGALLPANPCLRHGDEPAGRRAKIRSISSPESATLPRKWKQDLAENLSHVRGSRSSALGSDAGRLIIGGNNENARRIFDHGASRDISCPRSSGAGRDPAALTKLWHQENEKCRGGFGNDPRTDAACAARETYTEKLHAIGWCYGKRGESGYQMNWHRCGPTSLR